MNSRPATPEVSLRSAPLDAAEDGGTVLSTLVVNYNTRDLLQPCLQALDAGTAGVASQTIIVDNASRDGSPALLSSAFADRRLLFNEHNVGFGRANNQAYALAQGRYVLLLNTDAVVGLDTIRSTVDFLDAHPDYAVVGVRLEGTDGSLQPSCRYFPTPWNEFLARTGLQRFFPPVRMVDDMRWDHRSFRECDWVPGCYYLIRSSATAPIGLFDPRFFMYYEEVDHCRRIKGAGWKVGCLASSTVVHIGGASAASDAELSTFGRQISALQIESGLLYHRKHHGLAGLMTVAALAVVGDAILSIKQVMRGAGIRGIGRIWKNTMLVWKLIGKTRFGQIPTR